MINTGEIASFINNILVGTKKKEEHNKIVKEIVKKLVENNYIKNASEKVREVRFFKSNSRTR